MDVVLSLEKHLIFLIAYQNAAKFQNKKNLCEMELAFFYKIFFLSYPKVLFPKRFFFFYIYNLAFSVGILEKHLFASLCSKGVWIKIYQILHKYKITHSPLLREPVRVSLQNPDAGSSQLA